MSLGLLTSTSLAYGCGTSLASGLLDYLRIGGEVPTVRIVVDDELSQVVEFLLESGEGKIRFRQLTVGFHRGDRLFDQPSPENARIRSFAQSVVLESPDRLQSPILLIEGLDVSNRIGGGLVLLSGHGCHAAVNQKNA